MLCLFESNENATARKKNEKDRSGSLENYSFDREKLIREVENAISNEIPINLSEFANISSFYHIHFSLQTTKQIF